MLGAFWRPRGPEEQAVSNAGRAVAEFIDSASSGEQDMPRHRAAMALHEAWRALIAWQPARMGPDPKLGHLRALSRELHGLFAATIRESSVGLASNPKASAQARDISIRVSDAPTTDAPQGLEERRAFFEPHELITMSLAWSERAPRIALRVGAAALIAGAIGAMLGFERSYWAAAAAVLILHQGFNWVRALQRGLER